MNTTTDSVTIESTLPRSWEEEQTFNDLLYEWMERAPWLVISGVAHLMMFLMLAVIPWSILNTPEEIIVVQDLLNPVQEVFEEPPEEPDIIDPVETLTDPTLQDAVVDDVAQTDDAQDTASAEGDPQFTSDDPFQDFADNALIGVGGAAGGKFGDRFGGSKRRGTRGGAGTEIAVVRGLAWLAEHQDQSGMWDADGFMKHDPQADLCSGPGRAEHDVGVTALALLAFLGNGNTTRQGLYRDEVSRGVQWLREQQDFENGLIGDNYSKAFLYDHSIATLALCEAYYFSKSPVIRGSAQKAIGFLVQARNPYGVWRYDVPPVGDNDTSVTGWMIFALKSAEEGGLKIDSQAFNDSIAWFDEVTDPTNGRVGYSAMGEPSSREPGVNDHFPRERTEAMTAVGLLCRFFLGQKPDDEPIMNKHADLLLKQLPEWDAEEGLTNDMYYWYYGSYAMYQMGGKHWSAWNRAMKKSVLESQASSGCARGSWKPNGPWGHAGGRVYSTAMGVLCMEVYFRYSKVLGAR